MLVDIEGVLGRPLKEGLVGHFADVGLLRPSSCGFGWELALGHEVASKLLLGCSGDGSIGAEGFEAIRVLFVTLVKEEFVDAATCRQSRSHGSPDQRKDQI